MTYGFFSPTEASAAAVVYSIFLGLIYREVTPRDLAASCVSVGSEIASVLIIIAMGMMFGWILTIEGVPQDLASLIVGHKDSPDLMMFLMIAIIMTLGCFLEVAVLLLLLPPIIVPSMVQIGFDALHLGIVIILTVMIGMYTPPFGVALFTMQKITGDSYGEIVLSVLPWLIPLIVAVLVIAYVPWITTVLPRHFGF
jgi:tripartite ATP-independent transporter DctM subunit